MRSLFNILCTYYLFSTVTLPRNQWNIFQGNITVKETHFAKTNDGPLLISCVRNIFYCNIPTKPMEYISREHYRERKTFRSNECRPFPH